MYLPHGNIHWFEKRDYCIDLQQSAPPDSNLWFRCLEDSKNVHNQPQNWHMLYLLYLHKWGFVEVQYLYMWLKKKISHPYTVQLICVTITTHVSFINNIFQWFSLQPDILFLCAIESDCFPNTIKPPPGATLFYWVKCFLDITNMGDVANYNQSHLHPTSFLWLLTAV